MGLPPGGLFGFKNLHYLVAYAEPTRYNYHMKFILIETSSSFNHSKDALFDGSTVETVKYTFEKTKMVEVWVKEFPDLASLLRFVVDSNEEAVLCPPGTHSYGDTWVLEIYDSYRE